MKFPFFVLALNGLFGLYSCQLDLIEDGPIQEYQYEDMIDGPISGENFDPIGPINEDYHDYEDENYGAAYDVIYDQNDQPILLPLSYRILNIEKEQKSADEESKYEDFESLMEQQEQEFKYLELFVKIRGLEMKITDMNFLIMAFIIMDTVIILVALTYLVKYYLLSKSELYANSKNNLV